MRRLIFSACVLPALILSASAHAGGAAQAVSYTWTGLYGGINAGWGWGNSDWDFQSPASGSVSPSTNEGVVGIQFGYNAQMSNNLLLGVEADLDASRLDGTTGCLSTASCNTHVSSLGDVAARVGFINEQMLLYAKGGAAYQDATHHIYTANGFDNNDGGGAVYGFVLGGGIEYALAYDISAKAEYNYYNFGDKGQTLLPINTRIDVKDSLSLIKLGMNLKFTE